MTLRLYNTLKRGKEDFEPLEAASVRMYVCGPTVYDDAHIGNARPVIVFDVLFRLLRHLYGEDHVTYVRNVTDVDDKINARAEEEGVSIRDLTERTNARFQADMKALGCLDPTVQPRATEHVPEMIAMIERLIGKGNAYEAERHVLFDVTSDPDYGRLSGRSLDDMRAGARVEVAPYKRDPGDFVLWKPSGENEPGWESPWGRGRPGWHIECSAMSEKHLGEVFDIHGGGIDLVFPHHENEIAQSTCAHGTERMANVWMHNGFLQVEGRKMAKSEGNFVTVKDLLADWPGEVIRLAMLMTHYREPIDFSRAKLGEARNVLDGWYRVTDGVEESAVGCAETIDALKDDLNTSEAIQTLHALRADASKGSAAAVRRLRQSARFLGLLEQTSDAWFRSSAPASEIDVSRFIESRRDARERKDFAEADRIRDELLAQGIVLKDTPEGTTWEVKR